MRRRNRADTEILHCSFCRKSQADVRKLITSPMDDVRAYICDECVAVCRSILEDDDASAPEGNERQPAIVDDQSVFTLGRAVERWSAKRSSGADAAEELEEIRDIAIGLIYPGP